MMLILLQKAMYSYKVDTLSCTARMQARSVKFDVNKCNSVDVCACFDKPTLSHNAEKMFSKKGVAPAVELGVQTWQGTAGNEF